MSWKLSKDWRPSKPYDDDPFKDVSNPHELENITNPHELSNNPSFELENDVTRINRNSFYYKDRWEEASPSKNKTFYGLKMPKDITPGQWALSILIIRNNYPPDALSIEVTADIVKGLGCDLAHGKIFVINGNNHGKSVVYIS